MRRDLRSAARPTTLMLAWGASLAATPALAASWSPDPAANTAVAVAAGDQALPKSAVTSDGGRWVTWFDNRGGSYAVYAQRYDSKGHPRFPAGGMAVSTHPQSTSLVNWSAIADADDNLVVAFTDTRDGGDLDVHAYRIGSSGAFLWGADGVAVSDNADFEVDPMVTQTTTGDFVVVWGNYGSTPGVRMQRLSPAGVPQLGTDGVIIASETGAAPGFAEVVPGAGGDVVVSWLRDTSFSTSHRHVRAQAFTAAGTPSWSAPVEVFDLANLPLGYSPGLSTDGAGGAVVCWHVSNPSRSFLFDAQVQHLDASGAELFPHEGVTASTTATTNHLAPRATFNPLTGNVLVAWIEADAGQAQTGWYAQQLDAGGARMWGGGGIELLPIDSSTKYLTYLQPAGDGAIAVLGWAPGGGFGHDQIVADRLDATGLEVWGGPVDVSTVPSAKSTRLSLTVSADDEAVVFWEDARNGDDDIYAQNVDADGNLGATFLTADAATVSVTTGGMVTFAIDAGAAYAGKPYVVLGSNTGTSPGITLFGASFALNPGPYLQLTRNPPARPPFHGFRGTLDAHGRATATFRVPAGLNPIYVGTTLDHVVAVWDGGVAFTSQPVGFQLVP
ncbi:MAG: hypothetical protein H6733_13875 [Alphaproteobacteria bacterium]|nr:hypothetical protein [Alphaproteobacteria bacterium]